MKPLIAVVGPTGVGKSRLAVELASKFSGEIVNADSRQVYRYMNIGTAKPTSQEFERAPHHLFDILNPDQDFGLAQYIALAVKTIRAIHKRNHIPFLVGGSGQYVWSVLEGWKIPRVAPDLEFRQSLEQLAAKNGGDDLYNLLLKIDPVAASKIDKRNIRRVIRALEVSRQAEVPFSELQKKKAPAYKTLIIGLTAERSSLYAKVDLRVDQMLNQGLLTEVQELDKSGYSLELPSLNTIGYKQIRMMQQSEIEPDKLAEKIKVNTHRFIRHQYAWFRLKDERITWFDTSSNFESELMELVANHLASL